MPTLNLSFLNPKFRKAGGDSSTGYGMLIDQIAIMENQIREQRGGDPTPGDYDNLINLTRQLSLTPGLTKGEVSNFNVKLSKLEADKAVKELEYKNDLEAMTRDLENTQNEIMWNSGNNPKNYFYDNIQDLRAKNLILDEEIIRRQLEKKDTSAFINQQNEVLDRISFFEEIYEAGDKGFDGKNPINGYVAYVKTNPKGKIIDIEYGRSGDRSGYQPVEAMIGGYQVYGKSYTRPGDESNYFNLGNKTYVASNKMTFDPVTRMPIMKSNILRDASGTSQGFVNYDSNMAPVEIPMQNSISKGQWASDFNGNYYKKRDDGGITKFVNFKDGMLPGITESNKDTSPIKISNRISNALFSGSDETIDGAENMSPQEGFDMASMGGQGYPTPEQSSPYPKSITTQAKDTGMSMAPQPKPQTPSVSKPAQPKERASEGIIPTAQRTINAGRDYIKNLF